MIYSSEKWNNGAEIRAYINATTSLSWGTMEAPLANAWNTYLRPLLGEDMANRLIAIYNKVSPTSVEDNLLWQCQAANARLAMWMDYDLLDTTITDNGFGRHESEDFKSKYKHQVNSLKENLRNSGYNRLDAILKYIDVYIADFPEYKTSRDYQLRQSSFVPDTATVERYCHIYGSRLIYNRLLPEMQVVEDLVLAPEVGTTLLADIRAKRKSEDAEEAAKYTRLYSMVQPVVVFHAVARLIARTGSLTDRGLYFAATEAGTHTDESNRPADSTAAALQAADARGDGDRYLSLLRGHIRTNFTDVKLAGAHDAYMRDNTDRPAAFFL